ncbi:MAG: type VI secretion system-associated FHA domain protein TagH [Rubellimicrobium sp.]|nr:type VI secretion system-associated FHA domain protein TagH [Rubellimicrobium sp.]
MTLTLRIDNYDRLQDGGPIEVTIDRSSLSAGRAIGMDWVLPDPERQISKHHFDVAWRDGAYWLTDLSTNGVFVNGQRYRLDGPHRLAPGDRLQVGPYHISVALGAGPGLQPGFGAAPAMPHGGGGLQQPAQDFGDDPWSVDLPAAPPIDPLPRVEQPVQPDFTSDFISNPIAPAPTPAFPGMPSGLRTGGFGSDGAGPGPGIGLDAPPIAGLGAGPGSDATPGHGLGQAGLGQGLGQGLAQGLGSGPAVDPAMAGLSVAPVPFPDRALPPHSPAVPPVGAAGITPDAIAHVPMPLPSAPQRPAQAGQVPSAHIPSRTGPAHGAQAFVAAFCEGAGIDPSRYDSVDPVILARELGQSMRSTVAEVMALLQDRATAKKFTRSGERTMLGAMENNPLKFLPDTEQALEALFLAPRDGFQAGSKAMSEALGDVRLHQMALLAAVQPALIKLLADLEPEEIQSAAGAGLLSGGGKRKAWETYVERWDAKVARHENGMLDAFLAHFAEAYAAAVAARKG